MSTVRRDIPAAHVAAEQQAHDLLTSCGFEAEKELRWGAYRTWKHRATGATAYIEKFGYSDREDVKSYRIRLDRDPLRWRSVGVNNRRAVEAFVAEAKECQAQEHDEDRKIADQLATARKTMLAALGLEDGRTGDYELFEQMHYGRAEVIVYHHGHKYTFSFDEDGQITEVEVQAQAMHRSPAEVVKLLGLGVR
jgi:hypothetical protein